MEVIDLVIVGAGWSGLTAAKTYNEVNPHQQCLIVDQASSVGGVWAKDRLHAGLQTASPVGTYEFSDFPFDASRSGLAAGQRIPGEAVHTYMDHAVDRFRLRNKIWLESRVIAAEYLSNGTWDLIIAQPYATLKLQTRKLIIATGLKPDFRMHGLPGQEQFGGLVFHVRDLALYGHVVLRKSDGPVTVYGGDWAARNAVFACALTGRRVNWIVPPADCAYVGMALTRITPIAQSLENRATSRLFSHLNPSDSDELKPPGRAHRFLHRSWLGRKVINMSWGFIKRTIQLSMPEALTPEMQTIKSSVDPSRTGISFSHPRLGEFIQKGKVRLDIAEICHISPQTIHLSTGDNIACSTLILTGWDSSSTVQFLPRGVTTGASLVCKSELGLPQADHDEDFLRQFPGAPDGQIPAPTMPEPATCNVHPHRLARRMVPPAMMATRSLVFLGTGITPLAAPIQALWAAAYLSGRLEIPPMTQSPTSLRSSAKRTRAGDAPIQAVSLHSKCRVMRDAEHLGAWDGLRGTQAETLFYLDLLVEDLGLPRRRKSGVLVEAWSPYTLRDYRGVVREWKDKCRGSFRLPSMVERQGTGPEWERRT